MNQTKIKKYLEQNIIPHNCNKGLLYPASVYLEDGTYVPCVLFRSLKEEMNRIENNIFNNLTWTFFKISDELKTNVLDQLQVSTWSNQIAYYSIAQIQPCRHFLELHLDLIRYPYYTLTWNGFVLKMKDNSFIALENRTTECGLFFDLPKTFNNKDIIEVISHSYIAKDGRIKNYSEPDYPDKNGNYLSDGKPEDYDVSKVYFDKLHFNCYF